MTDHADISRRLALAIGHTKVQAFNPPKDMRILVWTDTGYRVFDYRAFDVIWPIAERFNCFPTLSDGGRLWFCGAHHDGSLVWSESASLTVALAVIGQDGRP